jgi:hypothetical protein
MLGGRNCKVKKQDAEHFSGTCVVNKFSIYITYSCHPGKEHFTSWLPIFPVLQVVLAEIRLYHPSSSVGSDWQNSLQPACVIKQHPHPLHFSVKLTLFL